MPGAWCTMLTEAAAAAASVTSGTDPTALPLLTKGLLTTVFGLSGVFLVLLLFYAAIRLLRGFRNRSEKGNG